MTEESESQHTEDTTNTSHNEDEEELDDGLAAFALHVDRGSECEGGESVTSATTSEDGTGEDYDEFSVATDDGEGSVVCETDEVCLLGEIVSAYQLTRHDPADDRGDDDKRAFCRVRYGSAFVHRTQAAQAGSSWRNPVWTLSTESLFAWTTTPRELARTDLVLSLWLQRKDPLVLTNETCYLGEAKLSGADMIRRANEQLHSLQIHDGHPQSMPRGELNVRFRLATPGDEGVVRLFQQRSNKNLAALSKPGCFDLYKVLHAPPLGAPASDIQPNASDATDQQSNGSTDVDWQHAATEVRPVFKVVTEKDEAQIATTNFLKSLSDNFFFTSSKNLRSELYGTGNHEQHRQPLIRVKPHPDPHRVKETSWLSHDEIRAATLQPSHQWLEAGSGTLGKLYLEILSCHSLPNVDVGEAVGNLTDPFVCAVFEDAMVQTPVIYDELSPHWLPWTQRAFAFGLLHPASILHLGVFDYDFGPMIPHEPLGRVSVNIAQLQRDTEYTLRYNLYKSANVTDRTPMGAITIRLRLTFSDEKRALLAAAIQPRPTFHINVRRDKSHGVVRYTCFGEYNHEDKFDMTVARSYINEILEYKSILSYCILDAICSLLFWQGQVRVCGLFLPIHSLLLFGWGTLLLDRPQLFPSFLLLSVAWILLATQTGRRQHPSPWRQCPSFWHYAQILYVGASPLAFGSIRVGEGAEEAAAYERQWHDRLAKDLKVANARNAFQQQMSAFDESIHTKSTSGWDPDLLVRLARYQRYLASVCRSFRMIKVVVTWEESVLAFWITACFLAGGFASLLLPWRFILLWTARLFVYGILGPHMKIVGLIVFGHNQHEKDDEAKIQGILEKFRKQSHGARLRHQATVKLKDVLRLSFGPYSTLTPALNLGRHYDYPLPCSYARLQNASINMKVVRQHVPGQKCVGIMIPRCGVAAQQFQDELPHLERIRDSVSECIQRIHDQESSELVRRLRSLGSHELDLPEAIGYELVSLLGRNGAGLTHSTETNIALGESSSLHLNAALDVAVMAVRKRRGRRNSMRASQRIEVVSIDDEDTAVQSLSLGPTSALLSSNDSRLAILETCEHRMSFRTSFRRDRRMSRRSKSGRTKFSIAVPTAEESASEAGTVEVVLDDQHTDASLPVTHVNGIEPNAATRDNLHARTHSLDSDTKGLELVYLRQDDHFVQEYKLVISYCRTRGQHDTRSK